jgi:hypothetical protein
MSDNAPEVSAIQFNIRVPGMRWCDESRLVNQVKGTIFGYEGELELKYGTIEFYLVQAEQANDHSIPLCDVCDADSAFLEHVYASIYDPETDQLRPELDIDETIRPILVFYSLKIKRQFRTTDTVVQSISTATQFFAPTGLAVAVVSGREYRGLRLTPKEWMRLGFAKIADSPFVFRDHCLVNRYTGEE